MRDQLTARQAVARGNVNTLRAYGEVIIKLMPKEDTNTVLFASDDHRTICHLYGSSVRYERMQDLLYKRWRCIGKVIGKIKEGESFDFLRGLPIGYIAKEAVSGLLAAFENPNLNIDLTPSTIEGPALLVAPMAIFA